MKKHSCFVALALLGMCSLASAGISAVKPKTIAVLEFTASKGPKGLDAAAQKLQDVFVTELRAKTKLTVIDKQHLADEAAKANISLSGTPGKPVLKRVGEILGVNYLLTGSVTENGYTVRAKKQFGVKVAARLIDTSTGEIVWADEVKSPEVVGGFGGGVDDIRALADQLIAKAKAKLK